MSIDGANLYSAIAAIFVERQETLYGKPGEIVQLDVDSKGDPLPTDLKRTLAQVKKCSGIRVVLHKPSQEVEVKEVEGKEKDRSRLLPPFLSVIKAVNELIAITSEDLLTFDASDAEPDEPEWKKLLAEDIDAPEEGIQYVDPDLLDKRSGRCSQDPD